jgi:hypothetical protein
MAMFWEEEEGGGGGYTLIGRNLKIGLESGNLRGKGGEAENEARM